MTMNTAQVAGLHNLRLVTLPGSTRLWRSSALLSHQPTFGSSLQHLGIATVIDLRETDETTSAPTMLADQFDTVHVPIYGDVLRTIEWTSLKDLYRLMVTDFATQLARATAQTLSHLDSPVLVHCTAGKDRTGLVCAIVQELAGVDRELVLTEYEASGTLLGADYLAELGAIDREGPLTGFRAHVAVASPRGNLESALAEIDRAGGAEQFLVDNGVDPDVMDRATQTWR